MRVGVTGASGLIGSALVPQLRREGHAVRRLVRGTPAAADEARWDSRRVDVTAAAVEGLEAVVHLAAEPIGSSRWTAAKKQRILLSRVEGTSTVSNALAALDEGPRVLVAASGAHYYGDRGDEVLTEDSSAGEGFLSLVCRAWEASADPARAAGARVVHLRSGVVLTPDGGALAKLLPLFRLGLGGRFGSGRQWWPWLTLEDEVGIIVHALTDEACVGALNVATPEPVTNAQLTRVLGAVLRRPAILPVPAFGPRLVLGELADALLFGSARMLPARLQALGYRFRHPRLEPALRAVLAP